MSVKIYNFTRISDMPKTFELDVSGISLAGMVDHLANVYGPEIKNSVIVDGMLADEVKVSINGATAGDPEAFIPDGSEVIFFSVVLGG